jgi:glycosyltransferase involved in cell wall biosynthesis
MIEFSVIVPVFNRPNEVKELLESLTRQTFNNFEVIIVEDGSTITSESIVKSFQGKLKLHYYFKPNSGPGQSRNYGAEKASKDFFIFFDSDCIIPDKYFEILTQTYEKETFDCFGGIDKAHESFTPIQKAIDYTMTSFFTTGGIRGGTKKTTKFYPRSFNMGFSRRVYETTKGYSRMRFGEDIDLSIRIEKAGFKMVLLNEAYVYHKRRTDFGKFYKQIVNSGRARINLFKLYPNSLKLTHFFPVAFVLFVLMTSLLTVFINTIFILPLTFYLLLILVHSSFKNKSVEVGFLSVISTLIQMFAYGLGFLEATWTKMVLNKKDIAEEEFSSFNKNFYK